MVTVGGADLSGEGPLSELSIGGLDAVYACVIFVMGLGGGLLPLAGCVSNTRWLGIGSSFGAGVFVAAGALHLLPDAAAVLDASGDFPFGMLIVSTTCIFMLVLENVLRSFAIQAAMRPVPQRRPRAHTTAAASRSEDWTPGASLSLDAPLTTSTGSAHALQILGQGDNHHVRAAARAAPTISATATAASSPASSRQRPHGRPPPWQLSELDHLVSSRVWTAGAMFVGLSFHSFMAGLSLGVTKTESTLTASFTAIIIHKAIAAFALGAAFVRARDGRCAFPSPASPPVAFHGSRSYLRLYLRLHLRCIIGTPHSRAPQSSAG